MHKNHSWLAFLSVIAFVVLGYSAHTLWQVYQHEQLTEQTKPTEIEWSVWSKSSDQFYLHANYTSKVNGKSWKGKTTLTQPLFRNRMAAQQAIPKHAEKPWSIWYSPSSPKHSSLQKKFPLQECISAGVLWTVLIYFTWLGYYVGKFKIQGEQ